MQLFETMKLEDGYISREDYHLKRLTKSSEQLKFNFDIIFKIKYFIKALFFQRFFCSIFSYFKFRTKCV